MISFAYDGDTAYFVANEARYPGRVVRAPLTAADIAAGFTGGVTTRIDTSAMNMGHIVVDALDLRTDYTLHLGSKDNLTFYGDATWQPRLNDRDAPDRPNVGFVGFANGPLRWRANAGIDWNRGPFTIGANGQYYSGYYAADAALVNDYATLNLPGTLIPPQFYLDMAMSYRFGGTAMNGPLHGIEFRLGIQNMLDHKARVTTMTSLGYSFYGDPRGRRFEGTIATHFR